MELKDCKVGPLPAVSDLGGFRAAWVKDPDGNTMAITEFSR